MSNESQTEVLEVEDNPAAYAPEYSPDLSRPSEDCFEFHVAKQVHVGQYKEQLLAETGAENSDILVASVSSVLGKPIGEDNKLVVFVVGPKSLDEQTAKRLLDEHEPQDQRSAQAPVKADEKTEGLLQQLRDGETLTTKELSSVLRTLIG